MTCIINNQIKTFGSGNSLVNSKRKDADPPVQSNDRSISNANKNEEKHPKSFLEKYWDKFLIGGILLAAGGLLLAYKKGCFKEILKKITPKNDTVIPPLKIDINKQISELTALIEKEDKFFSDEQIVNLILAYKNMPKATVQEAVKYLENELVKNIDLINFINKLKVSYPEIPSSNLSTLMQYLLLHKINPEVSNIASPTGINNFCKELNDLFNCKIEDIENLFKTIKDKDIGNVFNIDNPLINQIKKEKIAQKGFYSGIIQSFDRHILNGVEEFLASSSYTYKPIDESTLRNLIQNNSWIKNPPLTVCNNVFYNYLPKNNEYLNAASSGITTRESCLAHIEKLKSGLQAKYTLEELSEEALLNRETNCSKLKAQLKELKTKA